MVQTPKSPMPHRQDRGHALDGFPHDLACWARAGRRMTVAALGLFQDFLALLVVLALAQRAALIGFLEVGELLAFGFCGDHILRFRSPTPTTREREGNSEAHGNENDRETDHTCPSSA